MQFYLHFTPHTKIKSKYIVLCAQSCPTLCGPMDCSPPGSSAHAIFQARILELEWVPFPTPEDLLDPKIKPTSPVSPALAGADSSPLALPLALTSLSSQSYGFSSSHG